MTIRGRERLAIAAAALVVAGSACSSQAPRGADSNGAAGDSAVVARVVEAVVRDSLFGAITRFDYAAMSRSLTPTFELEEDTLRLSAAQLDSLVRELEDGGVITYRLDAFNTRVRGPIAWTSYRNSGTFTSAAGVARPLEWLETAVLVRDDAGTWRIDRLHSTPIRRAP